jgi:hypothetical protein
LSYIDKYTIFYYISLLVLIDLENPIIENSGLLEQKALNVLHDYQGANNYILKLKGIFNFQFSTQTSVVFQQEVNVNIL